MRAVADARKAEMDCAARNSAAEELHGFLEAQPEVDAGEYHCEEAGRHAIHEAALRGNAACLRLLLDHGVDANTIAYDSGCTALSDCACNLAGLDLSQECMHILIEAKADVNATSSHGTVPAEDCEKPLLLQLLFDHKADINGARIRDGKTLAMMASSAYEHKLPILQVLIDNKADINVRDPRRNTDALHHAILKSVGSRAAFGCATPFAVLSCNADAKNVSIDVLPEDDTPECLRGRVMRPARHSITEANVAIRIEEYKTVQAFIDEYHEIVKDTLSTNAEVDTRIGLGGNGIYLCSCLINRAAPYISPWES
jgi:hypothetical protein